MTLPGPTLRSWFSSPSRTMRQLSPARHSRWASSSRDNMLASSTMTMRVSRHCTGGSKSSSGAIPHAECTVRAVRPVRSLILRAALPVGAQMTRSSLPYRAAMAEMSVLLPVPAPPRIMLRRLPSAMTTASRCFPVRVTSPDVSVAGRMGSGSGGSRSRVARRCAALVLQRQTLSKKMFSPSR